MSPSMFSLSWEAHKNNICNGLSSLQQNNEFVDMTLAADGHFVKVHQMVMALASPYFKELITTAGGRHPVIFLNKISHATLSAILEYIYTGEVLISIDNLSELIQTAKELHIKGLEDMKLQNSLNSTVERTESQTQDINEPECTVEIGSAENSKECSEMDDEICYFEITDRDDARSQRSYSAVHLDETMLPDDRESTRSVNFSDLDENYEEVSLKDDSEPKPCSSDVSQESCSGPFPISLQYTVSNQGSIQMILNRYMYYLKHSNRNNTRQWRCVDYLNKCKCPAIITTKDNVVIQRISAHTHARHDRRILKKVRLGAIYTALKDAEEEGQQIKSKVQLDKLDRKATSTEVI